MTDDKRKPSDDVATLSGAYALNALSAEERAAFEAHLGESESLRHEVTELADTAVLLDRCDRAAAGTSYSKQDNKYKSSCTNPVYLHTKNFFKIRNKI